MKMPHVHAAVWLLFAVVSGCGGGSSGTAQVNVPNVVGDTQAAATTAITGAGLALGAVTQAASAMVVSGDVISENPASGTSVAKGATVALVVSSGPAMVAVPNVVGNTQAAATTAITGAGLTVGTVTQAASATVAPGDVISENPAANTSVAQGSAVALVVSTGPQTYSIGGSVSNLAAGTSVLLQDNGGDTITVSANGPFVFPTQLTNGATYNVTVSTQPTSQTCTVSMGVNTINAANVTSVAVSCSAVQGVPIYTVGGTVTGLTAAGLQLTLIANSGTDGSQSAQTLGVAANATTFTFGTGLLQNTAPTQFGAFVSAQPAGENCAVTNGFGFIEISENITSGQVTCVANVTTALRGVYNVTVTGAGGNPGPKWLALFPDGTYIFGNIQQGTCNGVDYGFYNFDAATSALKIVDALVFKPLAPCGFTDANGNVSGTGISVTFTGSGATSAFSGTNPTNGVTFAGTAVPSTAGTIVGAFTFGTGLDQGVLIFGTDGHYAMLLPQNDPTTGSGALAGLEYGCYTAANGMVNFDTTATCANAITNVGTAGFSGGVPSKFSMPYTTPDANTLSFIFSGTNKTGLTYKYIFSYTRIVPQ